MSAVAWARLVYVRLGWQARRPCDRCQPSMPCQIAQHTSLLADAASISLDLANAEASIERTRRAIPWA